MKTRVESSDGASVVMSRTMPTAPASTSRFARHRSSGVFHTARVARRARFAPSRASSVDLDSFEDFLLDKQNELCDALERVDGSDARVRGAVGGVGGDVLERLGASRKFEGAVARAAKRRRENDSGRRRTSLGV